MAPAAEFDHMTITGYPSYEICLLQSVTKRLKKDQFKTVMAADNGAHLPYGETGTGHYGANIVSIYDIYHILLRSEFFLDVAKKVPFPDRNSVYNIGDYGTADGAAAMTLLKKLIECLKEHHRPDVQFQVIYEDKVDNDFNSLFRRLGGLIPDPQSYLQDLENVYALASGTNFYKQCVPADSMHIILCIAGVHWLSGKPPVNKDFIYSFPGTEAVVRQRLEKQASVDWETFLIFRSRELKKGGLMIVAAPSDNANRSGRLQICSETFLQTLNSTWKEFRDKGRISKIEFINTNLACFQKSLDMLKSPFEDPNSKVVMSGLRLLSAELVTIPCGACDDWLRQKENKGVDDRTGYARRYVAANRCWSNSAFLTGLSESRSKLEKEEIVNELYDQVEKGIRNMNPETLKNDKQFAYLYITKK